MTDLIAVATQVVNWQGWRWAPGMRTNYGTILAVYTCGQRVIGYHVSNNNGGDCHVDELDEGELPDLSDPATLGLVKCMELPPELAQIVAGVR